MDQLKGKGGAGRGQGRKKKARAERETGKETADKVLDTINEEWYWLALLNWNELKNAATFKEFCTAFEKFDDRRIESTLRYMADRARGKPAITLGFDPKKPHKVDVDFGPSTRDKLLAKLLG